MNEREELQSILDPVLEKLRKLRVKYNSHVSRKMLTCPLCQRRTKVRNIAIVETSTFEASTGCPAGSGITWYFYHYECPGCKKHVKSDRFEYLRQHFPEAFNNDSK